MWLMRKYMLILVDENCKVNLDALTFIMQHEYIQDTGLFLEKVLLYFKNGLIVRQNTREQFSKSSDLQQLKEKITIKNDVEIKK